MVTRLGQLTRQTELDTVCGTGGVQVKRAARFTSCMVLRVLQVFFISQKFLLRSQVG